MADKTGFSSLHKQLEAFLLRRVKKDVEKSLPSKVMFFLCRSIHLAERLVLLTLAHEVPGSCGRGIQLMTVGRFIIQSLPYHTSIV